MKIIHGPTYRYQGEKLVSPQVIYIQDHHYDPQDGYALQKLLDASICNQFHHLLVFDHVLRQDEFSNYAHVCLPLFLAAECREFNSEGIVPQWHDRSHAFNFMINKPRPHRFMLLNMIHDLELTNYRHCLPWRADHRSIKSTDYKFGDERTMECGILNGNHTNASTYNRLLKGSVFEPTAVSLITEPAFYERETIITEKTLMAIWAGTLPIWVGGWRCADTMRDMGFDVFHDIIDHSYQILPDPEDRCRQAITRNLPLLKNTVDLRPFRKRLQCNLDLARSNLWLAQTTRLVQDRIELRPYADQLKIRPLMARSSTTS